METSQGRVPIDNGSTELEEIPKDEKPEDCVEEEVSKPTKRITMAFEKSMIEFLYVAKVHESGRDVNWLDKLFAIITYCVQCILYGYLLIAAGNTFTKDHVPVVIDYDVCTWSTDDDDFLLNSTSITDLMCEEGAANNTWGPTVPAVILFTWFSAEEVVAAVYLIVEGGRWAKLTGILLIIQFIGALLCCMMMAAAALIAGEMSDAILSAVGVSFIAELSKKVRSIYLFCPKSIHLIIVFISMFVLPVLFMMLLQGPENFSE